MATAPSARTAAGRASSTRTPISIVPRSWKQRREALLDERAIGVGRDALHAEEARARGRVRLGLLRQVSEVRGIRRDDELLLLERERTADLFGRIGGTVNFRKVALHHLELAVDQAGEAERHTGLAIHVLIDDVRIVGR